jgi:hypothetical protein
MASWGALPALSGARWSGVTRRLSFAPRLISSPSANLRECTRIESSESAEIRVIRGSFPPGEFACFCAADEGWGLFRQRVHEDGCAAELDWRFGQLCLREWSLALDGEDWTVTVGSQARECRVVGSQARECCVVGSQARECRAAEEGQVTLTFAEPLTLTAGEILRAEARRRDW